MSIAFFSSKIDSKLVGTRVLVGVAVTAGAISLLKWSVEEKEGGKL